MQLNDMTLFRQQALIDGQWRDAPNGDVIAAVSYTHLTLPTICSV